MIDTARSLIPFVTLCCFDTISVFIDCIY